MTTALLFNAGFSMNNAVYGQLAIDNATRTVSLNASPVNEAIVVIPTPSVEDFSPETEQQAGTKEKVLENSDESNDNGVRGKVDQAEIQNDEISESDQTGEEIQARASENEEKEDNSDAREEENDNDNDDDDDDDDGDDVPFELPFP